MPVTAVEQEETPWDCAKDATEEDATQETDATAMLMVIRDKETKTAETNADTIAKHNTATEEEQNTM